MFGPHSCDTKDFFIQLDNPLQFGLGKIKEIESFFIAEINDKEKMSKKSKHTIALDFGDKSLIFLSSSSSDGKSKDAKSKKVKWENHVFIKVSGVKQ